MLRDLWPGVTPKMINEQFTPEQLFLLLRAEDGWAAKKGDGERSGGGRDNARQITGDEMLHHMMVGN